MCPWHQARVQVWDVRNPHHHQHYWVHQQPSLCSLAFDQWTQVSKFLPLSSPSSLSRSAVPCEPRLLIFMTIWSFSFSESISTSLAPRFWHVSLASNQSIGLARNLKVIWLVMINQDVYFEPVPPRSSRCFPISPDFLDPFCWAIEIGKSTVFRQRFVQSLRKARPFLNSENVDVGGIFLIKPQNCETIKRKIQRYQKYSENNERIWPWISLLKSIQLFRPEFCFCRLSKRSSSASHISIRDLIITWK